jgi:hypothetical protein
MGYCRAITPPTAEPVTVDALRSFLNLPPAYLAADDFLAILITAAREQAELITGRCLAQRQWTMVLDAFPYWVDTIQSGLAYPPSFYSLPRYSTTLWNYSQQIKIPYGPVLHVDAIRWVDANGNEQEMHQDVDFVLDRITEPARVFPLPGGNWPPAHYTPNSVQINWTSGYDPDPNAVDTHSPIAPSPLGQQDISTMVTGMPQMLVVGILNLAAFWFNNRGSVGLVPENIERLFQQHMVIDFAGNRG